MGHPRLRRPGQPLWLRSILYVYEFLASLKLAVILIFASAVMLGWATFVESAYGLRGVQFGMYGTWWFTTLCALLFVNIFCAASIRYPWKRYQTGFVITHLGLLTLLIGCLMSRQWGVDAQMPVFEGGTNHVSIEDNQHVELTITGRTDDPEDEGKTVRIPFRAGPFNWSKYDETSLLPNADHSAENTKENKLFWLPWALAGRDKGVLYDEDGVTVEALDYYADSEEVVLPAVTLKLSLPRMDVTGPDGKVRKEDYAFNEVVELRLRQDASPRALRAFGRPVRMGGGRFTFGMTRMQPETEAFLDSAPEGPLGEKGQVVLLAKGEKFTFLVEEKLDEPAFDLGETGLKAEVTVHDRAFGGAVQVMIHDGEREEPQRMELYAGLPEHNMQDDMHQVYGWYWVDEGDLTSGEKMMGRGKSRIDVLQGADLKLYYRYFNGHEVVHTGPLSQADSPETAVDAFAMPRDTLKMYVERHLVAERPLHTVMPKPFDKDQVAAGATRAAYLRVTVDGNEDEFWLLGPAPSYLDERPGPLAQHTVEGEGREVKLRLPLDVYPLGFQVRLEEFTRKLDPGTSQASYYGSTVTFVDLDNPKTELQEEPTLIALNVPVDFLDPKTGRTIRLFQEAFRGPFERGSGIYEDFYRRNSNVEQRKQLYLSILTVNYDPGRGVKYIGCLLVVAGIATMFYMRAYFFKPRRRVEPKPAAQEPRPSKQPQPVAAAR